MRGPAVLFHVLGVALWLGGGFASMVIAIATNNDSPEGRARAARLLATLHQRIVSPGALVTLLTGFYLAKQLGPGAMDRTGVAGMMGTGFLAGLITLSLGLITANQRARVAQVDQSGQLPPVFEKLRVRQAVVMTVAGLLAITALLFIYLG